MPYIALLHRLYLVTIGYNRYCAMREVVNCNRRKTRRNIAEVRRVLLVLSIRPVSRRRHWASTHSTRIAKFIIRAQTIGWPKNGTIGQCRRRLECVVQQQGGHIEHLMQKLQDVIVALDNN